MCVCVCVILRLSLFFSLLHPPAGKECWLGHQKRGAFIYRCLFFAVAAAAAAVEPEEVRIVDCIQESPRGESKLFENRERSAEAKVMMEKRMQNVETNCHAEKRTEAVRKTETKRKNRVWRRLACHVKNYGIFLIFQQQRHDSVRTCVIFSSRR